MGELGRDLRHAVRGLRKNPAFTLVVVATLALGIGANVAIFSLMDQVLFRSLPVRDPGELVLLDGPGPFRGRTHNNMTFSYPMYTDFRNRNEVFAGVLARFQMSMTVGWKGVAERADGDLVSGNYFEVLGVKPAAGRLFSAADDTTPGAHPVAVISCGYWQRRFGSDLAILNQPITVNGHPFTIVGVAGAGFNGIQVGIGSDVMVPLMMKGLMTPTWNDLDNRQSRWVNVMARLKPGITAEQAEVQLNVVYRQANEQEILAYASPSESFRKGFVEKHLEVLPGGRGLSDLRQQFSLALIVLMSMVGVVLLIACANIANLLLARATSRQKEFAVRLALGAGRARIIRQQLVESLLLAVTGAILGVGLARWTGMLLISALPGSGPAQTLSASPDLRVVGFALTLAALTAVVFGIVPALQATRPAVTSSLKEEAGSVAGGGRQARVRRALVVGQVAMSMLLLAGAGLFARSLHNLRSVDPGFRTESLISFSVDPFLSGYDRNRSLTLYKRLQEELGAVPGMRAVSMSEIGALTGNGWGMTIRVDGYQSKEGENLNPNFDGVGPGYFATMGIPLVRGREFTDRDVKGAPRVAIINETMARYFFGDTDPIGRRFGLGRESDTSIEIVGVVKDVRSLALRETPPRYAYLPYTQDDSLTQLTFYVRAAGAQAHVIDAVRQTVRRLDANLPVFDVKSMDTQVAESLFVERMVAWLSVAFGALATLLAAIGLYGVMSYAVARRTREIGIRMALGAEPGGVLWLVLKEVALLSSIGIFAGLVTAFFAARRVESQLFGLAPTDPITLGTAVALLLTVALFAGFVPARRATRIDPLLALRVE
jgi:predicted permease